MTAHLKAAADEAGEMDKDKILEFRVSSLEAVVGEVRTAVKSIDASLKALTSLEIHHNQTRESVGRAFTDIEDHETRLRKVEDDMPTMRLVRNWVIAGVIGCTSMVGVAMAGLVIVSGKSQPAEVQQQVRR